MIALAVAAAKKVLTTSIALISGLHVPANSRIEIKTIAEQISHTAHGCSIAIPFSIQPCFAHKFIIGFSHHDKFSLCL